MWKHFCNTKIVRFLSSLKLAVCVILAMIIFMVWGTLTESYYNTTYAKWQVYHSPIFIGVQIFLFLNILFAALVRLPFKKKLSGFYIIHLGLLLILIGASVTAIYGLDGNIRLLPNKPNDAVIINEPTFYAFYYPNWGSEPAEFAQSLPKVVHVYQKPNKIFASFLDYDIYINQFLPFSSPKFSWKDHEDKTKKTRLLGLELSNSMFNQNVEISTLEKPSQKTKLGPLTLAIYQNISSECFQKGLKDKKNKYLLQSQDRCFTVSDIADLHAAMKDLPSTHLLNLEEIKNGPHVLFFYDNKMVFGKEDQWQSADMELNKEQDLPWMGFKLTLLRIVDNKYQHVDWYYDPPKGSESKRHFSALITLKNRYKDQDTQSFWIDDTEIKQMVTKSGSKFEFMIGNELYNIPFHLDLNKFKMDVNPGTNDPASYESFVNISDPNLSQKQTAHIFMNNPLKKDKLTFYQASYFALDDGETFGSVLSVNYDPGRIIKYIGSILLVFGSILHFTIRSINKKSKRLKPIQASG